MSGPGETAEKRLHIYGASAQEQVKRLLYRQNALVEGFVLDRTVASILSA